jgi:hypothetical protein
MQPIASTCLSSTWSSHDFHDMQRGPPTVTPPPVLRPDWETLAWLTSMRSKPVSSSSSCLFCGAIDKRKPVWFWAPNEETIVVILRPKSSNHTYRFWGQSGRNRHHQFWSQPKETVPVVVRPNHWQTVSVVLKPNHWQTNLVVLRPNHLQTVDLGSEAQPRNSHSSSTRAWCRPHTVSPDLSIV